ncbi:MAG: hypothetical protein ACLRZH_12030 [Ruthenibacterium lactatiformans]
MLRPLDFPPQASRSPRGIKPSGELGPEFYILRQAPLEDTCRAAGPCVEGIRRLRCGQVSRTPGFDGQYGTVNFSPTKIESLNGQIV